MRDGRREKQRGDSVAGRHEEARERGLAEDRPSVRRDGGERRPDPDERVTRRRGNESRRRPREAGRFSGGDVRREPVLRRAGDDERPVPARDENGARPPDEAGQPVAVSRRVETKMGRPDRPRGKRRKPRDARGRRTRRDDDGVGPEEALRRLDPRDASGLDVERRNGGGAGHEGSRPPGREKERTRQTRRGELTVSRKGERRADRGREGRLPRPRLLGGEDLERKGARPLPVERPVEEDFLGFRERHGEAAADVVHAREPRLLLQRLDPLAEEVTREEREIPHRLGRGVRPGLRLHDAGGKGRLGGRRAFGVAEIEDDRLDTAPCEGEAEGEAREAGSEDDDVGTSRARRRDGREAQATSPFASTTGPVPGISGGP